MDRAPGRSSRARPPHAFLRALQAGAHRRGTDDQALCGRPVGATGRHESNSDRSLADAARLAARSLGAAAAIANVGRLEEDVSTSRTRRDDIGEDAGSLRLAWKASRSAHHGASQTKVVVTGGACTMIARVWHGYTTPEHADTYEAMLKPELLPGISKVKGYKGSYLLRRNLGAEVEFITILLWESIDALRA